MESKIPKIFDIYILWYKGITGMPLHWSFFVCAPGSVVGNKYDVTTKDTPLTPRLQHHYVDGYDRKQWDSMPGYHRLGVLEEPADFQEIVMGTPPPTDLEHENCQTWIWKVIRKAVTKDTLDKTVTKELENAVVYGP
jgi:hypothetical protein